MYIGGIIATYRSIVLWLPSYVVVLPLCVSSCLMLVDVFDGTTRFSGESGCLDVSLFQISLGFRMNDCDVW